MHEARKSERIGSGRRQASPRATPEGLEQVIRLAVRFLAQRDRTIAQVVRYLTSRGASSLQVEHAIHRLSDLRYLDDQAYAQRWVDARLAAKPMGQERLKAELSAKGISDGVVSRVLAEVFRQVSEEILAHRALEIAHRHGRRLQPYQLARLLHQRGFSDEVIEGMMAEFRRSEEPIDEE